MGLARVTESSFFYTIMLRDLYREGDYPTTYGETVYSDADLILLLHERKIWVDSLLSQNFNQIFSLFSEKIRPKGRRTFKAYDGTNNLFNLAYEILSWKVHRALIKTKLEPYLGFLH